MFHMEHVGEGVVRLKGRLDASAAEEAMGQFRAMQESVTLDCAQLDYISSAGIGVVVETFKRLKQNGFELKMVHATPRVRNVFMYAGLDKIIPID